jgi:hypothetical protein
MGTRTEIVLKSLADADPRQFNVLHPIVAVGPGTESPILVESISVVQIRPDAGDTYHDYRFADPKKGQFALSGMGLQKIAAAAGIRWITGECQVEDRERRLDGHVYIRYRATGAVRQPNGEWFRITAHKEIDTADVYEQMIDQKTRKAQRDGKAPDLQAIHAEAKRDILQVRENILGLAESKAMNRVIRKLLSLRQVYMKAELSRPFAVPRLIYRPDLVDARTLEQAQIEGHQALADTFGPVSQLPGPTAGDVDVTEDARPGSGSKSGRRRKTGGESDGEAPASPKTAPDEAPPGGGGPSPGDPAPDGEAPHAFAGEDDTGPCSNCGWAAEHPVHKAKQGRLT